MDTPTINTSISFPYLQFFILFLDVVQFLGDGPEAVEASFYRYEPGADILETVVVGLLGSSSIFKLS